MTFSPVEVYFFAPIFVHFSKVEKKSMIFRGLFFVGICISGLGSLAQPFYFIDALRLVMRLLYLTVLLTCSCHWNTCLNSYLVSADLHIPLEQAICLLLRSPPLQITQIGNVCCSSRPTFSDVISLAMTCRLVLHSFRVPFRGIPVLLFPSLENANTVPSFT